MPLWVEGASAQTLERIGSAGVIKIGYREDAPPFSFKTEIGEPAGYTVDLCRKIAADVKRELGLAEITVDYVTVGTDDRFQAVAEGKIDILCGATTATLSRRELVSFSLPTFVTGVSALLRADAPSFLREVLAGRRPGASARSSVRQALADRTFAVRANTTAETWLRESLATLAANAEMVSVESHEEGLALVLDKNADAYFADRAILVGLIALSDRPAEFEIADRFFTYEPYALALGKGDEAFRLSVDRTLSRLYRSGEIVQIFGEYFGVPGKAVRTLFQINSLPE
jgi:ABC-type amino acid transport substrate-binding protein